MVTRGGLDGPVPVALPVAGATAGVTLFSGAACSGRTEGADALLVFARNTSTRLEEARLEDN